MGDEMQNLKDVYLAEYSKLKDEQAKRIGFRDNLLYVMMAVYGGIIAFALSKPNCYALLVLPWASLILGWTYLQNDEKVSAIGRYIRLELVRKIQEMANCKDDESIFGWEIAHRSDARRERRKVEQLVIDETAFVLSGAGGLLLFYFLCPEPHHLAIQATYWAELALLSILGIEIVLYADLAKGR